MAPEAPTSLVVLDIEEIDDEFLLHVHGWEPSINERLFVLWNAVNCPPGYESVANVVCVAASPSYQPYVYDAAPRAAADRLVLTWRHWTPPGGALMLVAALPPGYAFAESLEGTPEPIEAKAANGRVVVFWRVTGNGGADVRWRIEALGDRLPRAASADLNDRLTKLDYRPFDPEPAPPTKADLDAWAAERPPPTVGPPAPVFQFQVFGGSVVAGDSYSSQMGAAGPGATTFNSQQSWNAIAKDMDLAVLADELARLQQELAAGPRSTAHDRALAEVAAAEDAARAGDGPRALDRLSKAGSWVLGVATQIGIPVATATLKHVMGLP